MEKKEIEEYIFLLLRGKATAEQGEELRVWMMEEEEHRQLFEDVCRTWYQLKYSVSGRKIDTSAALQRALRRTHRKVNLRKWGLWSSGVAALIGICLGSWKIFQSDCPDTLPQELVVEDVQSGEKRAMLTLADGRQIPLASGQEVKVDLGFARAVEDSVAGLVYQFKDSVEIPVEYHTITVPRAGEYIMVLSDGSRVWLNAETEMKYPVSFDARKREIYIKGEAFFEVVKDVQRPFIVHTPYTQTTVLGTAFNVMAYEDVKSTEITLVSGKVAVGAGGKLCRIFPGQQVAVNNHSLQMESREVNVGFYTSWKNGLFDFEGMSLRELCLQLSRWYDVDFFFVDQTAENKRFTGAVKRNNSLRFMLEFVEKTSNVRFEVKGKTVSVYDR